jgi:hypothetical protein
MSEWQPIETAPKDEADAEDVIFWLPESRRYLTSANCWWLSDSSGWSTDDQPTLWTRLQELPN